MLKDFPKALLMQVIKKENIVLALLKCIVIFWFLDYKVAGERYVYKFVCDPEALFSMAFPDNQRPVLKTDLERQINEEDTVPLSHFDENMAYIQEGGYCNPHPYNEGYVYWKLLPAVQKQNKKLSYLSLISFSHSPGQKRALYGPRMMAV